MSEASDGPYAPRYFVLPVVVVEVVMVVMVEVVVVVVEVNEESAKGKDTDTYTHYSPPARILLRISMLSCD